MPRLMGSRLFLLALVVAALGPLGACGKEIGDSCAFGTDCSQNGDRICIDATAGQGGYCTIQGCDYSTCPDEAACIRFFTGEFSNKACDPIAPIPPPAEAPCTADELCALTGHCVPRSSEVRFCMRTCDSNGDCRDGYECRDLAKMKKDGGEPVLAPGVPIDDAHAPKFCAVAPSATTTVN
jgi:hypothetical protein